MLLWIYNFCFIIYNFYKLVTNIKYIYNILAQFVIIRLSLSCKNLVYREHKFVGATHRDLNNFVQLGPHACKIRFITSDAHVSERDEISRRGESPVCRRHSILGNSDASIIRRKGTTAI